ncbi:hypothetical protein Pmani_035231 [Petrolisthes manimaculis]|uniref:Uncharacterized protein n=1 Tax=Petrolisthes manimaculis TaxID=1843537 RepID=A0AAE1TNW3_9EUCA|nr:hypothetical protein Pmani_035231 [Petrolisthes manimaculis]
MPRAPVLSAIKAEPPYHWIRSALMRPDHSIKDLGEALTASPTYWEVLAASRTYWEALTASRVTTIFHFDAFNDQHIHYN